MAISIEQAEHLIRGLLAEDPDAMEWVVEVIGEDEARRIMETDV